jgi:hypothetical protein
METLARYPNLPCSSILSLDPSEGVQCTECRSSSPLSSVSHVPITTPGAEFAPRGEHTTFDEHALLIPFRRDHFSQRDCEINGA